MYTKVILLSVLMCLLLVKGIDATLTACATPGLYLSEDQQTCFGYAPVTTRAHNHATACDGYASKLVSIDSADKLAQVEIFLTNMTVTTSNEIFIGLANYLNDETVWVWYGGNITSYTNWASGEPTDTSRYNCVYMTAGNPDYKWSTAKCLTSKYGMCEREATDADRSN